jgi:hypothetical protein
MATVACNLALFPSIVLLATFFAPLEEKRSFLPRSVFLFAHEIAEIRGPIDAIICICTPVKGMRFEHLLDKKRLVGSTLQRQGVCLRISYPPSVVGREYRCRPTAS